MKNLKIIMAAIAKLGLPIEEILKDKKITLKDLPSGLKIFNALRELSGLEFGKIVGEAKAAVKDPAKRKELTDVFDKEFEIDNDEIEGIVEEALEVVLVLANAGETVTAFIQKIKKFLK